MRCKEDNKKEERYFSVNTNYKNNELCHDDILKNQKVATYRYNKHKIEKLKEGDYIFLYQSGNGIVARGIVKSGLKKSPYPGKPKDKDEEYYRELKSFSEMKKSLKLKEIKNIIDKKYPFRPTLCHVDREDGKKIWEYIDKNR